MGSSGFGGAETAAVTDVAGSLAFGAIIAFTTALDTLDCVNLAKAGVERSKLVFELVILAMMISSGKPAVTISITESLVRISWPTTTPMSSKAAITKNTNRLFSISALLNRKTSSHPL